MSLSEILKSKREAAGLSQPELAEKSGVPVGTIRGIEQGKRPDPQWSTIQLLAVGLGITCHELTELPKPIAKTKKKK